MRKIWRVLSMIAGTILAVSIIWYRTQIDQFFQTTSASNYLLIGLIAVDGLGNLLTYYFGKRDEGSTQRNQKIEKHIDTIMEKFNEVRGNVAVSWQPWGAFFKIHFPYYRKEFLQHLCTGNNELYLLMKQNIKQNKPYDLNDPFIQSFIDFINGVNLKGRSFGGVCDQCINLYGKKEKEWKTQLDESRQFSLDIH